MYFALPSFDSDHQHLHSVAWGRCISFYAIIIMFGMVAQWAVKCNAIRCHQIFVFDFVATFVFYGCGICHSIIANLYGPFASISTQLVVNLALIWMLVGSANPLPQVMALVTCCDRNQREMVFWRMGSNMLAGLVSHPFSKMLWLQLNHDVSPKIMDRLHCSPCLSVPFGFGIEFFGTLLVCGIYASSVYCPQFEIYEVALKLIIDSFIQTLGSPNRSIHLNPALAGSRLFGCGFQPEIMNGLVVHGLAPVTAAILYTQYTIAQLMAYPDCPLPVALPSPCGPFGPDACNVPQSCGPASPFCPQPTQGCCPPSPTPPDKITAQRHLANGFHSPGGAESDTYSAVSFAYLSEDDDSTPPGEWYSRVKQSRDEDGNRKVDYVLFFPPMCTEKGIRLRHKFLIDQDGVYTAQGEVTLKQNKWCVAENDDGGGKKSSSAKIGSDSKLKESDSQAKGSKDAAPKSDSKTGGEKTDKKLQKSANNNKSSRHRRH